MWSFAWHNLVTRPTRTALAVLGLTIPVLAFLGLFSVSNGIRDLMGGTLEKMQGLMVLRENSPSPVFSDLPADMVDKLPRSAGCAWWPPEVWRVAPPIDGRGGLAGAALGMFTRSRPLKSIAEMIVIEGQDIAEHLKLKERSSPSRCCRRNAGGGGS